MRAIEGLDNNAYIPAHSSVEELAEEAMAQIREEKSCLEKSIRIAREKELDDEADEYQKELDDLTKHTKGSLITKYRCKKLDKGESMKKITSAIRSRRRTAIKNLRKDGFNRMADDLKAHYHVGDRYVIYFSGGISPNWILDPPQ